ncbi:hypothetical protein O6H91_06G032800 [Diphasiastrum complanatum]|uniref:Uncharacterized protein n=2 Tax=Diphasiastrum complanatum TaxID=34168 RepID=A0ACC2DC15_DIPCM|nr:hypothetical protein O6H91_06G032600 [Diphasiastrum complanatum]KAJ7551863.1 hypothetical protein O6H91_06G032800 [Diphasiastrum complanatum]
MGLRTKRLIRKICVYLRRLHDKLCVHCQCHRQAWHTKATFSVFERKKASALDRVDGLSGPMSTDGMLEHESEVEGGAIIRLATLNVAHFSRASAVPSHSCEPFKPQNRINIASALNPPAPGVSQNFCLRLKPNVSYNPTFTPRSTLSLSPSFHTSTESNPLHNSISYSTLQSKLTESFPFLEHNAYIGSGFEFSKHHCVNPTFSPWRGFHSTPCDASPISRESISGIWSVLDVLREANADIVALQEVKAHEEKGMRPLSDLAEALGMNYAYAESWAPEFGNAVLSRWPIKSWSVKRIHDDTDYRNVLKVVVDIPLVGEVNFHCTHLDHLDEDWRLKQVQSLTEDTKGYPHILVGDLNSLKKSDYSKERWTEIAKVREENGKLAPKDAVMEKLLKEKGYIDSVSAAGEEDDVITVPNGQMVQGTCKYGTRLDYILASPLLPYRFVPGSYSVISSRGTSDHHLVKVDIQRV